MIKAREATSLERATHVRAWNLGLAHSYNKAHYLQRFQTWKSRDGLSAIGWQAAARACQPMTYRLRRDFRVRKRCEERA